MGSSRAISAVLPAISRAVGWLAPWHEMREDPHQPVARPRQIDYGAGGAGVCPHRTGRGKGHGRWRMTGTPAFLFAFTVLAQGGAETPLRSLCDGHRWFELRDAIEHKRVSSFYAGAVAFAFNHVEDAEKHLSRAARQAADVDEAHRAHGMLAYLYTRLGRSRAVVRQFDSMLRLRPGSPDVLNARALFAAFSRYPDQSIGKLRRTSLRCDVSEGGLTLPVLINGRTVHWGLDTGANLSIVSEAEAQMLGLSVDREPVRMGDLNAGTLPARTTVAPSITIGGIELKYVPLLVVADTQPPMNVLPPGERGLLGLPVAYAFQTFRWSADGTFEIGSGFHPKGTPVNLCFDELAAVLRMQFDGKPLDLIFDTGNGGGTQLWESFSREFPVLVKTQGIKETRRVTQLGGSGERDVVVLPGICLRIGGFGARLEPAHVFAHPVGNEFQHGLLGMDLLSQAREVSVDFRSMSVVLK